MTSTPGRPGPDAAAEPDPDGLGEAIRTGRVPVVPGSLVDLVMRSGSGDPPPAGGPGDAGVPVSPDGSAPPADAPPGDTPLDQSAERAEPAGPARAADPGDPAATAATADPAGSGDGRDSDGRDGGGTAGGAASSGSTGFTDLVTGGTPSADRPSAPGETGATPAPRDTGASPTPRATGASPTPHAAGVSPSPRATGASPAPGDTGVSPAPGDTAHRDTADRDTADRDTAEHVGPPEDLYADLGDLGDDPLGVGPLPDSAPNGGPDDRATTDRPARDDGADGDDDPLHTPADRFAPPPSFAPEPGVAPEPSPAAPAGPARPAAGPDTGTATPAAGRPRMGGGRVGTDGVPVTAPAPTVVPPISPSPRPLDDGDGIDGSAGTAATPPADRGTARPDRPAGTATGPDGPSGRTGGAAGPGSAAGAANTDRADRAGGTGAGDGGSGTDTAAGDPATAKRWPPRPARAGSDGPETDILPPGALIGHYPSASGGPGERPTPSAAPPPADIRSTPDTPSAPGIPPAADIRSTPDVPSAPGTPPAAGRPTMPGRPRPAAPTGEQTPRPTMRRADSGPAMADLSGNDLFATAGGEQSGGGFGTLPGRGPDPRGTAHDEVAARATPPDEAERAADQGAEHPADRTADRAAGRPGDRSGDAWDAPRGPAPLDDRERTVHLDPARPGGPPPRTGPRPAGPHPAGPQPTGPQPTGAFPVRDRGAPQARPGTAQDPGAAARSPWAPADGAPPEHPRPGPGPDAQARAAAGPATRALPPQARPPQDATAPGPPPQTPPGPLPRRPAGFDPDDDAEATETLPALDADGRPRGPAPRLAPADGPATGAAPAVPDAEPGEDPATRNAAAAASIGAVSVAAARAASGKDGTVADTGEQDAVPAAVAEDKPIAPRREAIMSARPRNGRRSPSPAGLAIALAILLLGALTLWAMLSPTPQNDDGTAATTGEQAGFGPRPAAAPAPASLAQPTVRATVPAPAEPVAAAASAGGAALVAVRDGNRLLVLDPATDAVTGEIGLPGPPRDVTTSPDGTRAFVTVDGDAGGQLAVVDVPGATVLSTVPVPADPQGVVSSADGRFVSVPSRADGTVVEVDPYAGVVTRTVPVPGEPAAAAGNDTGDRLYLAAAGAGELTVLSPDSLTVLGSFPVAGGAESVAVTPASEPEPRVAVGGPGSPTVTVLDPVDGAEIARVDAAADPSGLAFAADGRHLYIVSDQGLQTVDTRSWEVTSSTDVALAPTAVTVAADGRTGWVTGRGEVSVLNLT